MKMLLQLVRQPLKLIAGLLVAAFGSSILCVCIGQAIAAENTATAVDALFTTAALETTDYNFINTCNADEEFLAMWGRAVEDFTWGLPEAVAEWINGVVQAQDDLVKFDATPGLASAYLPELTYDSIVSHDYFYWAVGSVQTAQTQRLEAQATYACAMFEVELTEIGEPETVVAVGVLEDGSDTSLETGITVELQGTIRQVVSIEGSYDDPTGRIIYITLELPDEESLAAQELEPGSRYLVYGDYLDGDWVLRGYITEFMNADGTNVSLQEIDESCISYYSEFEIARLRAQNPNNTLVADYVYPNNYALGLRRVALEEEWLRLIDAAMLTVRDGSAFGSVSYVVHESGRYPTLDETHYITGEDGEMVEVSQEEWQARYAVPTIAKLEGTVEEFLASEEGALWQQQLSYMEINYHAFPIIGVQKLGYIADFARDNARIVEGRDFTQQELDEGAKVCIVSETLASMNGLSVGDTITPQFYNYDWDSPNQKFISDGYGVINPWAYRYSGTTEFAGEAEEYVIVGLYRQSNAWIDPSENIYSFTPNTIFVPENAVVSDMDYGNQGFFRTLILRNGMVEPFRVLVEEAGYEGLFVYYDQGYNEIIGTVMDYGEVSQKAMMLGAVVYGVILLLFLLLFPGSQGKSLSTMTALGAKRSQKIGHVFLSSAWLLVPGTVLGTGAGMLLWNSVVGRLTSSVDETLTVEMEPLVLVGIAVAQLVAALGLTVLLALFMTRDKGLKRRK
ncbi:MAG: ABC transporter permease [Firmicutes bacterium]|nr:ABC transporter permease [Bacillota bacterium]